PTLTALEDFLTDLNICLLIVSHDRFFMDKLCTKLLVCEGNGVIKEWIHSYTELREMQKERAKEGKEVKEVKEAKEEREVKEEREAKGARTVKKMTYAERNELKKLDKEMPALEKKKEEIAAEMVAKSADHHAIMELSIQLEKVTSELEKSGDRWLVLMEKQEAEGA
ncbi:MAG: ABC transporter ATP-binding protein, partial [Flavobacteriales bacterium]|nr:ABC transporter ATP-binding protein [Flavobacteriales bacterium]